VDEVRWAMRRDLKGDARAAIKDTRDPWLKNPWNLRPADLLQEAFRDCWSHTVRGPARQFLRSKG
jgi:hypothetical protein